MEEEIESYAQPIKSLHDQVDNTLGDEVHCKPFLLHKRQLEIKTLAVVFADPLFRNLHISVFNTVITFIFFAM